MGLCVSLNKDADSAMKLRLSSVQSKNEKLIIPSPVTVNYEDHSVAGLAVKSQRSLPRFHHDGSKDEAFFDSQPWLESDCEDDFLSVNGDFTPSRGTTPVHHKFSSIPEPSPTKRLSELFKESLRHREDGDEESDESVVIENGASNERASSDGVLREEKSSKSAQCCLPRLRPSQRKKKTSILPDGT